MSAVVSAGREGRDGGAREESLVEVKAVLSTALWESGRDRNTSCRACRAVIISESAPAPQELEMPVRKASRVGWCGFCVAVSELAAGSPLELERRMAVLVARKYS